MSTQTPWRLLPLVEVATLQRGFDLPVQVRVSGSAPIFAANGPVGFHNDAKVPGPGVVTGRSGSIGKVHFVERDFWPLNTALYVKDFHGNDPRFVFYLLQQMRLEQYHEGTGVPTLNRNNVHRVVVSVPPLSEQRRIAAILDKADELRAKRRAAFAQLDSISEAIFVDLFSEGSRLEMAELKDLCELITDGTHYTPEYSDHGVIFLSAKNVTSGSIDWKGIKFIPESLHLELRKRISPRRNDILLAKNGTTGVAAIVDKDCVFDIYVSLALLRPKRDILPVYLHAALNSSLCRRQFHGALKGIGVPNLHLIDIRKSRVPHPSLALQNEFANRIGAVEKLKTLCHASWAEMDALFASLQHRAFRGEL